MKLSRIMEGMTLQQRRRLSESVVKRIVEGGGDSGDQRSVTASEPADNGLPSDTSPVGSALLRDGKPIFEKTQEGWKTTLRISEDQVLELVRDDVKDQIKKDMRAARGQGDELHIAKTSLKDPGAANKGNELLLQRDGSDFADPVPVRIDALEKASAGLDLSYTGGSGSMTDGNKTRIGDAVIDASNNSVTLTVPNDQDLNGFDDLFGASTASKIRAAIQKAVGSKSPGTLKIPLSYALDGSIMKFMSDSMLRGLGIGKIKFELNDGNHYVATVNGDTEKIKEELEKRKNAVKPKP